MKLNVRRDDITFGTNILDVRVPEKLRERHACGVPYIDTAFGGKGFTPSTITLFTGEPGAGKTTLMLELANALTSQSASIWPTPIRYSPSNMTKIRFGIPNT